MLSTSLVLICIFLRNLEVNYVIIIMQFLNVYFHCSERWNIENSITIESTPGYLLAIIIHLTGRAGLTEIIKFTKQ